MPSTPARRRAALKRKPALESSIAAPDRPQASTERGSYKKTILDYEDVMRELRACSDGARMGCIADNKTDMSRCSRTIFTANYEQRRCEALASLETPLGTESLLAFDSLVTLAFCSTHCTWKMIRQLLAKRLAWLESLPQAYSDDHLEDYPDSGYGWSADRKRPLRTEMHEPPPMIGPFGTISRDRSRRKDASADERQTNGAQVPNPIPFYVEDQDNGPEVEAEETEAEESSLRDLEMDDITENVEANSQPPAVSLPARAPDAMDEPR
jgi:hypothetical protein